MVRTATTRHSKKCPLYTHHCFFLSPQHRDGGGDPGPGRLFGLGHLVQCPQIHTYRGDGRLCDISMDNVDITEKGKNICHVKRAGWPWPFLVYGQKYHI